jgi:hypothetical protein
VILIRIRKLADEDHLMNEACWSDFKCFSVWHLNECFNTNKCISWTFIYSGYCSVKLFSPSPVMVVHRHQDTSTPALEFGLVQREFAWLRRFPVLLIPSARILEWYLRLQFFILDVLIQIPAGIQRNVYVLRYVFHIGVDITSRHKAAILDVCAACE